MVATSYMWQLKLKFKLSKIKSDKKLGSLITVATLPVATAYHFG